MSKSIKAPPVPKATLTVDDVHELRVLSAEMERELISSYEQFVQRDQRQVDEKQWKHVRSQEEIHVYKERRAWRHRASQSHSSSVSRPPAKSDLEIGPHAAMAVNSSMPRMMATGTSLGTMDDAVYGTSFHNTATLRARNAYQKTNLEDNAVLATIEGPTQEDPYRFLGLVWYYKLFPIPAFMNSREFLMLMAIHTTQLSNGERVGVAMYHSVQHRDVPEPHDSSSVLRAEFSLLILRRQIDDRRLELFIMNFVEPHGSMPRPLVLQETARSVLSVTNACDVAFRRKLLFRVLQIERRRKSSTAVLDSQLANHCAQCNKSFGIFSGSGCTCRICGQRVCSKCSATRNIFLDATDTAITMKPFDFCTVCAVQTREMSALAVAREELHARSQCSARQTMFDMQSETSLSSSTRSS